jgi:excisionase family DNA binding protein
MSKELDGGILIGWKAIGEALGVSASTARRWTRELGLPTFKLGGQVRVGCSDLERWVRERRRGVGARPGP